MKNEHVRVVKELDGHYTAMQNDMQVAPPSPPLRAAAALMLRRSTSTTTLRL
jgi:hypothetical protein